MSRGDEVNATAEVAQKMSGMGDAEFERCITAIRSRYWESKDGIGRDEFAVIMSELGLGEASTALFEALDNSEGVYPRGSGVVDAVRLADGLNLLAGRCLPEERVKFISANPRFLPDEVPARSLTRMKSMRGTEFEECLASIRSRQWRRKDGVDREEFDIIMRELGLGEASAALFKALDNSEGLYPRGSGVVDAVRLVDGLKLLAGRCLPDERVKIISANPGFLSEEIPARSLAKITSMSDKEFAGCLASIRSRQWPGKGGVDRDEFNHIMHELGLGEVSTALFDALDDSDGMYPQGSGVIDLDRFLYGMSLLSGRCLPDERIKFISSNPRFLPDKVPPRLVRTRSGVYK